MLSLSRRGVSPVIAIVLLLMITVAAAGAAYFWLTSMQSSMQESSRKSIENIMEATGRRVTAQATLCKPTYPYEGLVGYWMMDEGSGDYANDSSGNGNDGTLHPGPDGSITSTSGMWVNGKVDRGVKFDGNDSYGIMPSSFEPYNSNTDPWSMGCWFYIDELSSEAGDAMTILDNNRRYHMELHTNDQMYSTPGGNTFAWDWYPPKNTWHHAMITYDGEGTVRAYVDGQWRKTVTGVTPYEENYESGYFGLGSHNIPPGGGRPFNGTIDEVRIYNRALSENEIKELYEAENHSARRRIDVTVRNIGSEEIPKATWVANLKQDGTAVETDAYNASSIDTGDLATLKFYFKGFKPNTEYTIELQGTGTSTTVSC